MKILNVKEAKNKSHELREKGKSIVLTGGVFDILHIGHVKFLEKAKKEGDSLFILLESDESVRKSKGPKRPINSQSDRAKVLSALETVDFVVLLKGVLQNKDYDKIVKNIGPKVLATSKEDSYIIHKKRQAKLVGGKVSVVIGRLKYKSTSKILEQYE